MAMGSLLLLLCCCVLRSSAVRKQGDVSLWTRTKGDALHLNHSFENYTSQTAEVFTEELQAVASDESDEDDHLDHQADSLDEELSPANSLSTYSVGFHPEQGYTVVHCDHAERGQSTCGSNIDGVQHRFSFRAYKVDNLRSRVGTGRKRFYALDTANSNLKYPLSKKSGRSNIAFAFEAYEKPPEGMYDLIPIAKGYKHATYYTRAEGWKEVLVQCPTVDDPSCNEGTGWRQKWTLWVLPVDPPVVTFTVTALSYSNSLPGKVHKHELTDREAKTQGVFKVFEFKAYDLRCRQCRAAGYASFVLVDRPQALEPNMECPSDDSWSRTKEFCAPWYAYPAPYHVSLGYFQPTEGGSKTYGLADCQNAEEDSCGTFASYNHDEGFPVHLFTFAPLEVKTLAPWFDGAFQAILRSPAWVQECFGNYPTFAVGFAEFDDDMPRQSSHWQQHVTAALHKAPVSKQAELETLSKNYEAIYKKGWTFKAKKPDQGVPALGGKQLELFYQRVRTQFGVVRPGDDVDRYYLDVTREYDASSSHTTLLAQTNSTFFAGAGWSTAWKKDFTISGKFRVRFDGESGIDVGGLTKEWLTQTVAQTLRSKSVAKETDNGVLGNPSINIEPHYLFDEVEKNGLWIPTTPGADRAADGVQTDGEDEPITPHLDPTGVLPDEAEQVYSFLGKFMYRAYVIDGNGVLSPANLQPEIYESIMQRQVVPPKKMASAFTGTWQGGEDTGMPYEIDECEYLAALKASRDSEAVGNYAQDYGNRTRPSYANEEYWDPDGDVMLAPTWGLEYDADDFGRNFFFQSQAPAEGAGAYVPFKFARRWVARDCKRKYADRWKAPVQAIIRGFWEEANYNNFYEAGIYSGPQLRYLLQGFDFFDVEKFIQGFNWLGVWTLAEKDMWKTGMRRLATQSRGKIGLNQPIRRFANFFTGMSSEPMGGWGGLSVNLKIQMTSKSGRSCRSRCSTITAHTCFNTADVPCGCLQDIGALMDKLAYATMAVELSD